jgi:hypothetical protein
MSRAEDRALSAEAVFCNGPITVTPGARDLCRSCGVSPFGLVNRHVAGDYGAVAEATRRANERATRLTELESMRRGGVVMSDFAVGTGAVWVLTDRRHGRTMVLLPEEYADATGESMKVHEHG